MGPWLELLNAYMVEPCPTATSLMRWPFYITATFFLIPARQNGNTFCHKKNVVYTCLVFSSVPFIGVATCFLKGDAEYWQSVVIVWKRGKKL